MILEVSAPRYRRILRRVRIAYESRQRASVIGKRHIKIDVKSDAEKLDMVSQRKRFAGIWTGIVQLDCKVMKSWVGAKAYCFSFIWIYN